MRSKPKKSDCGFCDKSCNNEWCSSKAEPGYIMPIKLVTREELEKMYPPKRTESEQFIYDLIRMHGGGIID